MLRIFLATIIASLAIQGPIRASDAEAEALKRLVRANQQIEDENHRTLKEWFKMPFETVSPDGGTVIMGLEGHIFVHGGRNAWEIQLNKPDCFKDAHYESWVALLRERQKRAAKLGARFFQMAVPDKQLVIPHLRWVKTPDTLVRRPMLQLQARLKEGELLYPLETLTKHSREYVLYPRDDSHWNPLGCWLYFKPILNKIWPNHEFSLQNLEVEVVTDPRSSLLQYYDKGMSYTFKGLRFVHKGKRISTNNVYPKNHLGHYEVWHNPDAPIKETAVILGNSFMFLQGLAMLTNFVERITMFWHPHIPWKTVEGIKPNVILWQTCERFLSQVPLDTWNPPTEQIPAQLQKVAALPSDFSALDYAAAYKDLSLAVKQFRDKGGSEEEIKDWLERHYREHGIQEGRSCKSSKK